jgi:phage terminase large subunit-like protein
MAPDAWAQIAVRGYHQFKADRIVGESNNGGEMIERVLRTVDRNIPYRAVHASRGKIARAEPVSALYAQGRMKHVGLFPELEEQMCSYVPGQYDGSPDRLDALVWAISEFLDPEIVTTRVFFEDRVRISPY